MTIDYTTLHPMTITQKLNPFGAHLLHEYYSNNHNITQNPQAQRKIKNRFITLIIPKICP